MSIRQSTDTHFTMDNSKNNDNDKSQNEISQNRSINNTNTLERIARLTTQITNKPFENNLFNGTNFNNLNNNNNVESLILPSGCFETSSFPYNGFT
ncbi:7918_t:CDS:2 [Funneliformis mosseae]|uniref:7918_t:CDS:1 n=1 Tax=Funneliformis mosseae TaxID=27381 RepID=A0A9N9A3X7_FUNMO|nr:7918_t:CDS:2 [Funneliformis mosseae]